MMNLERVEHILRAAGDATGQRSFVLIGSAAIFAWRTFVPEELATSREADLYALTPDLVEAERIADALDAILGQQSLFDETHGYYCDGVGPETAILPYDWQDRAKLYTSANTNGVTALVPEPNDLALSKLCAGREKDMSWLVEAARAFLIDLDAMRDRFERLPRDREQTDPQMLESRLAVVRGRLAQSS